MEGRGGGWLGIAGQGGQGKDWQGSALRGLAWRDWAVTERRDAARLGKARLGQARQPGKGMACRGAVRPDAAAKARLGSAWLDRTGHGSLGKA